MVSAPAHAGASRQSGAIFDGLASARVSLTMEGNPMPDIHPLRIEVEREEDGRLLASVPELPGVMVYGETEQEAVRRVKAIALQVLADMIESGEEVPESLRVLFAT
jgi:predicted RNase H-like HicB family nuclease